MPFRVEGFVDVVGNSVYNHASKFTAIATFVGQDVVISRNLVFNNGKGISARGLISENRVYNNEGTGIATFLAAVVERNVVYDNDIGINATVTSNRAAIIRNNLVYNNDSYGILVESGASTSVPEYTTVINNTIYEPTADGLRDRAWFGRHARAQQYHPGGQRGCPLGGGRQPDRV